MATYTANAAAVGTALVAAAGQITGITMAQPTATSDMTTPLTLVDQAAAPANAAAAAWPAHVLFSAPGAALMPGDKPNVPLTPGLTAPTWPRSLGTMKLTFSNGIFVASCPANMTFTITA
jgi:hypothetical protein